MARLGPASFPMTSNHDPFSLKALSAGPIAWRALRNPATGRVIAVFERCFYVDFSRTTLCIGPRDFSEGPLNVVTDAPASTSWSASGLRVGDPASLTTHHILAGSHLRFDLSSLSPWLPEPRKFGASAQLSLVQISNFYRDHRPNDGLAAHIFEEKVISLPRAQRPLSELATWLKQRLRTCRADVASPISKLLGMGPGLTPSGDDFIGAMMITLRWLDENGSADDLARAVGELAPTATNPVSAQHLHAAGEGYGSDALHDLLNAIADTDTQRQRTALKKLVATGHSSGWDALAGVYATLKVWQDVQRSKTLAA